MIRQMTRFGLLLVVIAGCRPSHNAQSDATSTAAITSLDHPWFKAGVAPVVNEKNSSLTAGSTRYPKTAKAQLKTQTRAAKLLR